MITLSHVSKKFGFHEALRDVSFSTKRGEIIGFLGPNGAGKTTTMRIILGILAPTSGSITIEHMSPIAQRMKLLKNVGYLAENNPLYPEMTVEEYLLFIASVKNAELYYDLLYEVGLEDYMHSTISTLSRGYKQRVGLAAAIIGDPDILVLDEPTSGLDPIEQKHIRDFISRLGKEKTIIFSTHILSEVEDIAKRLIIINKGEIVFDGNKPKGKGKVESLFTKIIMAEEHAKKKKRGVRKKIKK
ncbi:ABC transporter ATP-binding protein [Candidatus Woesebacteria bacterium]|nr:ABC transporter ATP-binding protein [Candidatus Woesebacteria bacterium]